CPTVYLGCRLGIGSFDQAEHSPCAFIEPILKVAHIELLLRREVRLVCTLDGLCCQPFDVLMDVHEQWHGQVFLSARPAMSTAHCPTVACFRTTCNENKLCQGDVHRIPGHVRCFDGDIPYIGLYRTPILEGLLIRRPLRVSGMVCVRDLAPRLVGLRGYIALSGACTRPQRNRCLVFLCPRRP